MTADMVFTVGFYTKLCGSIGLNLTKALTFFTNYKLGAQRIEKFLRHKELALLNKNDSSSPKNETENKTAISIRNLSFSWDEKESTSTSFRLGKIDMNVEFGQIKKLILLNYIC